ncbi:dehydrogenase/reductase SDR family member 12 isoform X2 [Physeter macrocephalus]|uniref:Dehydrogenase/reductase SDR family member 12 isoform X2 n=1 Tax=Physeter macrocephalus TaxID=9755 RepID=A0A9W2X202_PHYMC|nr:dehydrogenase/reductase SDR family member 12 isoform X2 [Physeter catodon]
MVNKRELTEDGLEKNFATNTLGVYVLTTALIPVLEKEHDPRVITVSSGGMLVQKLNTDDLQSERTAFDGTMVYAQNKKGHLPFRAGTVSLHLRPPELSAAWHLPRLGSSSTDTPQEPSTALDTKKVLRSFLCWTELRSGRPKSTYQLGSLRMEAQYSHRKNDI